MNYKLKWGFGGLPPIIMFICIDCVVYNQFIIHDASPNIAQCQRYCVQWGILQVGPPPYMKENNLKYIFVIAWSTNMKGKIYISDCSPSCMEEYYVSALCNHKYIFQIVPLHVWRSTIQVLYATTNIYFRLFPFMYWRSTM